ncbi:MULTISPECIES: TetR/AcrR family transcriptional regulator [Rhodococcus]|uniref:Putative TetR family transcriptional regulator n=1 Tax=Rhodococcus wratislaviensis NBRC 100605 TaxID=1219028 RepID=X0QU56_RHOWR|nr:MULTISPECIES: TetR/AcrR family transcriptional regulator [Rhodococcus]WAM12943.1 helix-turn-helix domain containing protein [Rhodococcus sp. JS3073]GAF42140.1 putative TetR family transcriptional regulator [Rhodococcus wratislaviensis NBRC 100605]
MRADALERRNTLIKAARAVFADRGHDAPLDAIAAEAGVGIATLYRNFPSRDELAHAVARTTLAEVRELAVRGLDECGDDPEGAWWRFVDAVVELRMGALVPALVNSLDELPPDVRESRELTKSTVTEFIRRLQDDGLVREDVVPLEIIMGIAMLTRPHVLMFDDTTANLVPRLITVFLAGLRPDGAPLPPPILPEPAVQ